MIGTKILFTKQVPTKDPNKREYTEVRATIIDKVRNASYQGGSYDTYLVKLEDNRTQLVSPESITQIIP